MEQIEPEIIGDSQAITLTKENGTQVAYYLFDTFEIHSNLIPAGCIQDWHQHQQIEEIIVAQKGILTVEWLTEGQIKRAQAAAGEKIRLKNSIHRISNPSEEPATCVIFRFVQPSENQAETIKQDKKIYSDEDIQALLTIRR